MAATQPPDLQRIYGIAFRRTSLTSTSPIEETKLRYHCKLDASSACSHFRDEAPGFPFYLPKGMVLKNT